MKGRLFKKMIRLKNLPNFITISRMALSLWIIKIGIWRNDDLIFLVILAAAGGISDVLDGWLAKKKHWESALGAALDPAADKLFISATAFTLISLYFWPLSSFSRSIKFLTISFTLLFVCVEVLLIIFWTLGLLKGISLAGSKWGKWKMCFFCVTVYACFVCLFIEYGLRVKIFFFAIYFIHALLALTIISAGLSADDYWQRYLDYKKSRIKINRGKRRGGKTRQ